MTTRPGVILLCGPSGAGKSRLAERLRQRCGLTLLTLDDFYRDVGDPALPIAAHLGIPDWDDPRSWDAEAALRCLEALLRDGRAVVPVYDIGASRAVGSRRLTVGRLPLVVAEGIFAADLIAPLRAAGLLQSAWCVRRSSLLTFVLRLARDLREHRKPPLVLVRRGLVLARAQRTLVDGLSAKGARPATPRQVERAVRAAT